MSRRNTRTWPEQRALDSQLVDAPTKRPTVAKVSLVCSYCGGAAPRGHDVDCAERTVVTLRNVGESDEAALSRVGAT